MSIALPPAPAPPSTQPQPQPPEQAIPTAWGDLLYRLNIGQYHAMAEAGVLGPQDRVELLEGLLVAKMTKNDAHLLATELAQEVFTRALPAGWSLSMQNPITIAETNSEPEPDAKVVRGARRDDTGRRVTSADVAPVVEVADSSVRKDQVGMKAIYAQAAIPFDWLLNIPANRIEVHPDPTGADPSPDDRRRTDHGPDDAVPLTLDGREVARISVRDLLP